MTPNPEPTVKRWLRSIPVRPALIRLVDIGLHDDFTVSMSFAQSLIESMGARAEALPAQVEYIRTRDQPTIRWSLSAPAHVLHVMAHGMSSPDAVEFLSDDEDVAVSLSSLAEKFASD